MANGRIDLRKMRRIGHLRRIRVKSRPNEPHSQGNIMLRLIGLILIVIIIVLVILWII